MLTTLMHVGTITNQNHSSIDGSIYGYYRGDQYQAHGYYETWRA